MRSFHSSRGGPSWVLALVIFVALVLLMRFVGGQQQGRLVEQFAPTSGGGSIQLPPVPTEVIAFARTATARIMGGFATRPLAQEAGNGSLHVRIDELQPVDGGLRISGSVANIGAAPLDVSLDAFRFTDAAGTVYAAPAGTSASLAPGQNAPLEITLPVQNPAQLKLDVALPDQPPLELVLLNAQPSP
jgi:hypothetical protein